MSRVIVKKSLPKPRVIVKAPTMMVDASGKPMFMYGGAGGGTPTQRTRASKILGGIGQVAGAGLAAATGRHRDLMSLISGMQGGSAVGRQVGDWLGQSTKLIPGSESRMARRTLDEKARQAYRGQLAERDRDITKPSLTLRERMEAAPLLGLRGRSSQNVIDNRLRNWAREAGAAPQGAAAEAAVREKLNNAIQSRLISQQARLATDPQFAARREATEHFKTAEEAGIPRAQIGTILAQAAKVRAQTGGNVARGMLPVAGGQLGRAEGFALAQEQVPDPNSSFADHEFELTLPDAPGNMNPPDFDLPTGTTSRLREMLEQQGLDPESF